LQADPHSALFDLGQNPLNYSRRQRENTAKAWPEVIDRIVRTGKGYRKGGRAFQWLLRSNWSAVNTAARFPGGITISRHHKGDKDGRPPFVVISAQQQRDAMNLLVSSAFSVPDLKRDQLNYLAVSRWSHWGMRSPIRLDYPV